MIADNENKPRMAFRGEWVGDTFWPETSQARLDKEEVAAKRKAEKQAMHRERARLAIRMKVGKDWDGKADNDNINWPLATSLIREGNTELLKAAMAYRKVHANAHSGAVLGGQAVSIGDGFALDRHIHVRPNGTIAYKHVRQRTAASVDIPANMKVAPYVSEADGVEKNTAKVPSPWNGDRPVNDKIDAQSKLIELRNRLGILAEPLEMAVVDGATYQAVGNANGIADRSGSIAAGRAIVHMALISARDAIGAITREDLAA